jgi:hypothetical protein
MSHERRLIVCSGTFLLEGSCFNCLLASALVPGDRAVGLGPELLPKIIHLCAYSDGKQSRLRWPPRAPMVAQRLVAQRLAAQRLEGV